MANDQRFLERRHRGYATMRELTDQDIADNPIGFAGAQPGDLAVDQNGSGLLVVMTREQFDEHYEPEPADVTAQLADVTARLEVLEKAAGIAPASSSSSSSASSSPA